MTIPSNTPERVNRSYIESPTRADQTAAETVVSNDVNFKNVSPFGEFDKITASYPSNTREVYTYSLNGSDIGSVTVDYTDASKKLLSIVSYDAV